MDSNKPVGCIEEPEEETEVECQFILRLPEKHAAKVRKVLQTKPKKIKQLLSLNVDPEKGSGTITYKNKNLKAKLVKLPTILESYKSADKVHIFKTADVSHMLVCEEDDKKVGNKVVDLRGDSKESAPGEKGKVEREWPHGITPPLKNVKRVRFRKVIQNKSDGNEAEIEKEVLWLLRMDNSAVSSRFDFVFEENKDKKVTELDIFGDMSSSESEDSSEGDDIETL